MATPLELRTHQRDCRVREAMARAQSGGGGTSARGRPPRTQGGGGSRRGRNGPLIAQKPGKCLLRSHAPKGVASRLGAARRRRSFFSFHSPLQSGLRRALNALDGLNDVWKREGAAGRAAAIAASDAILLASSHLPVAALGLLLESFPDLRARAVSKALDNGWIGLDRLESSLDTMASALEGARASVEALLTPLEAAEASLAARAPASMSRAIFGGLDLEGLCDACRAALDAREGALVAAGQAVECLRVEFERAEGEERDDARTRETPTTRAPESPRSREASMRRRLEAAVATWTLATGDSWPAPELQAPPPREVSERPESEAGAGRERERIADKGSPPGPSPSPSSKGARTPPVLSPAMQKSMRTPPVLSPAMQKSMRTPPVLSPAMQKSMRTPPVLSPAMQKSMGASPTSSLHTPSPAGLRAFASTPAPAYPAPVSIDPSRPAAPIESARFYADVLRGEMAGF